MFVNKASKGIILFDCNINYFYTDILFVIIVLIKSNNLEINEIKFNIFAI